MGKWCAKVRCEEAGIESKNGKQRRTPMRHERAEEDSTRVNETSDKENADPNATGVSSRKRGRPIGDEEFMRYYAVLNVMLECLNKRVVLILVAPQTALPSRKCKEIMHGMLHHVPLSLSQAVCVQPSTITA